MSVTKENPRKKNLKYKNMDTETPTTEVTPDADIPAIKLGDIYDHCLLGATVKGRFAYSIKELMKFQMRNYGLDPDQAREAVSKDIVEVAAQFGAESPEFIDDELMEARVEIIMP
jgi:hypothetical protein